MWSLLSKSIKRTLFEEYWTCFSFFIKSMTNSRLLVMSNRKKTEFSEILFNYDVKNLVISKTCFKNPLNSQCNDLFITNIICSFQNTTLACGLLDFHKMNLTVLKSVLKKSNPQKIVYRNYKKFQKDSFKSN